MLQSTLFLLLWVLQGVSTTFANEPSTPLPNDRGGLDLGHSTDTFDQTPISDPRIHSNGDNRKSGSDLVERALQKLETIPRQPFRNRRRRDGVFSKVFNHVLKEFPHYLTQPSFRPRPQEPSRSIASGEVLEAVNLLEQSAQYNNADALYILAELNFYGNYTYPRNFKSAFEYYRQLADGHGNSSAMYMVGFMYSTGIGAAVGQDQARALLYYTFAALRGHTRAEMAVGARHHAGIGTPKSCDEALKYYKRVADKAISWYRSGPPGGMAWVHQPYRIADELGGVYGEGASAISSGINAIRAQPKSDSHASIEDIIEYLDLMAQKGDYKAALSVGRIYYEGQRNLDRDLQIARKYFLMVATKYWRKDGRIVENPKPSLDKTAGKAAGYLGRMHLRGDGVDQNFDRARSWFERGIVNGDAQSQYNLGLMFLKGYGVSRDIARASELLKAAAEQDYAPARVELGVLYLDQGRPEDLRIANDYFEFAARYSHIEAYYYLAEMIHHGVGRDKSCGPALSYYKAVSEKADPLVSSWTEANLAYDNAYYDLALLEYLQAAEQGYEKAQNNVGYLLDPQQSCLKLPPWTLQHTPKDGLLDDPALGLIHWTRSSRQNNVDSLVKMGDYYLYGIGTEPDIEKAVQCYTGASEYHQSAQALYNLGWMHENGVGLEQDFHLAKRFYDSALETNDEAYLPVTLSLLKLRIRSAWNTLTHGKIKSIQDDPVPSRSWTMKKWIDAFSSSGRYFEDDIYEELYEDLYDEFYLKEADSLEDDLTVFMTMEVVLIGCITMAIIFLFYYRQQRQLAHRQQEQQRQQQAPIPPTGEQRGRAENDVNGFAVDQPRENGGALPLPNDIDEVDWLAGAVGQ